MNKLYESGVIKTMPRKWTDADIEELKKLKSSGLSNAQIAKTIGRSEVSVQIKLKRLGKSSDKYNTKHRDDKYLSNSLYFNEVQPRSILDVYAGNSYWKNHEVQLTTNDKDPSYDCDYNEDALRLLCRLYYERKKYDVVDLDPYGSAAECFELALRLARKGIIVTLGEMGHKRWKRLDFVRKWYNINSIDDFTEDNIIKYLSTIAARQGKELTVVQLRKYSQISRVYFSIGVLKTTEQWGGIETEVSNE